MSVRPFHETLDARAFETAVRAEAALDERARADAAREELRWRETCAFRDEMRRAVDQLRLAVAGLHDRIDAIHLWIRAVLSGLVVGLLGVAGFLFSRVMGW